VPNSHKINPRGSFFNSINWVIKECLLIWGFWKGFLAFPLCVNFFNCFLW
jgi:hypothetical protein